MIKASSSPDLVADYIITFPVSPAGNYEFFTDKYCIDSTNKVVAVLNTGTTATIISMTLTGSTIDSAIVSDSGNSLIFSSNDGTDYKLEYTPSSSLSGGAVTQIHTTNLPISRVYKDKTNLIEYSEN